MFRLGILLLSAYTLGHGHFRDARPELLDLPLALFHDEVNAAFADASDRMESLNVMHPHVVERCINRLTHALESAAS